LLIRAKAPLRLSFSGGGTDVPPYPAREGGCVLSATIDRYAYGTLRPRTDKQIRIQSVDLGLSANYTVEDDLFYDGKLDLVKAAIKKLGGLESRGLDLFLNSDEPPGTGLGSSSTVMVALVGLLKELTRMPLTDYEIAHHAYIIEREELELKGGLQDQYAAPFGGFNFIEFFADRVVVTPLKIGPDVINELEHNLLLCYTGKTRLSANIIEDQTERYLRGDQETLAGMRRLKALAVEMKNALLRREFYAFGEMLHEAWEAKKRNSSKITSPEIDAIYQTARRHGAIGGKLTGAGGGGYLLLYCHYDKKHHVAAKLKEMGLTTSPFSFSRYGLQTWRVNELHG
jgi:D-glycero-alpha-D-manno-heptose-7-phosphate kinase